MHSSVLICFYIFCVHTYLSDACEPRYRPMVDEILETVKGLEVDLEELMKILPNQRNNDDKLTYCISRPSKLIGKLLANQMCPKNLGIARTTEKPWTPHPF